MLVAVLVCAATGGPGADVRPATAAEKAPQFSGPFTDEELAALTDGFDALPEKLQKLPRPLHITLDETLPATPSGIAEPEWRDGVFVLTRQEGHVTFRDATLPEAERRALWRRRAVIHAVLSLHEDIHRWSATPRWRRTNGWILPFERPLSLVEHPLNLADTAYARPRGKQSARLDFLTFAEAALVPVTNLPTDDLLRCQEFTRLRALHQLLGTPWTPEPCPAFDGWRRGDALDHLEVLLVQSSARAPESLFGHLLVRPVWKTSLGPSFDTVVQFAAITLAKAGPAHLVNGLFGGYSLGLFTISQTDLEREKLSGEQRSMTRWRLTMSPREMRRFMERAWEWERRGRFSYAFFSDNCATLLIWMLESALDDSTLVGWPGFITSPAGVLDDLYRARRPDGRRLLEAIFPSFESTAKVARRDEDKRRLLEATLEPALRLSFAGAHASDVETRRRSYPRLAAASRDADVSLPRDLFAWWALSARIERSVADVAHYERRELEQELVELPTTSLDTIWNERLTTLERESTIQERLMILDRDAYADDLRRRSKKRAMTPGEQRRADDLAARLALFDEVTTMQGDLNADVFNSSSATTFLEDEVEAVVVAEVTPATRSLPVSGHFRAGGGVGLWRRDDGLITPVLRFESGGLREAIGAQRHRGVAHTVGVRMLEGGFTIAPSLQTPAFVQSHFNVIAFDTIAQQLPPSPRWQDFVGFGFEVGTDYRRWRSQHAHRLRRLGLPPSRCRPRAALHRHRRRARGVARGGSTRHRDADGRRHHARDGAARVVHRAAFGAPCRGAPPITLGAGARAARGARRRLAGVDRRVGRAAAAHRSTDGGAHFGAGVEPAQRHGAGAARGRRVARRPRSFCAALTGASQAVDCVCCDCATAGLSATPVGLRSSQYLSGPSPFLNVSCTSSAVHDCTKPRFL